jgi:hypothetical protein
MLYQFGVAGETCPQYALQKKEAALKRASDGDFTL